MKQIDDQLITLVVLVICIIICFKTRGTIMCTIIGSIIMSIIYKNKHNKLESIINLPSLLKNKIKKIDTKTNKIKIPDVVPPKEKFYINNNSIKMVPDYDYENEIETEMHIELIKTRIRDEFIKKEVKKSQEEHIKPIIKSVSIKEPIKEFPTEPIKEEFMTREDVSTMCLSDSVIDGDEQIAYSGIHRNEPTRVIAGMGRAYQNLSRYVLEEIQEVEGKEWWGNNDY